jgi:hypothetical protein
MTTLLTFIQERGRASKLLDTSALGVMVSQGEHSIRCYSGRIEIPDSTVESLVISLTTLHNDLLKIFADKIAAVIPVQRIYMSHFEKEIDIWTILKEDTEIIRQQLYDIELDLVKRFREFAFEFHIFSVTDINFDEFEKDPSVLRVYEA